MLTSNAKGPNSEFILKEKVFLVIRTTESKLLDNLYSQFLC